MPHDPPPTGTILLYLGTAPPEGWMVCDGSSHARSKWPALAAVCGGTGATFTLPNLDPKKVWGPQQAGCYLVKC